MKLEVLVRYLANDQLEKLFVDYKLDEDSEALLIYMEDLLSINSDVYIFEIEVTEDYQIYEREGIRFIQLFPLEMAHEMVKEYINTYKNISHNEIAQRLIEYRINDA